MRSRPKASPSSLAEDEGPQPQRRSYVARSSVSWSNHRVLEVISLSANKKATARVAFLLAEREGFEPSIRV